MKTHYSNPRYAEKMLELHEQRMRLNPPAIPFTPHRGAKRSRKTKKKEDSDDDGDDDEKAKTKTLDLRMDPSQEDSPTHTYKVTLFREGTPEQWLKFLIEFEDTIVAGYPLTTFEQKLLVFRTLLDGPIRDRFDSAIRSVPAVTDEYGTVRTAPAEVHDTTGTHY
jgi:hypothetical protein